MADYLDALGQYGQRRFDQASDRFTDPSGFGQQGNEANVKPRSTTINYNEDGSQTVTQKHDVTPGAESQMAPAVPQQMPVDAQQQMTPAVPQPDPMQVQAQAQAQEQARAQALQAQAAQAAQAQAAQAQAAQAQPVVQPGAGPIQPTPIPNAPPLQTNTVPGMYSDIPAGAPVTTAAGQGVAPPTAPSGAVLANQAGPVSPSQMPAAQPVPTTPTTPTPEFMAAPSGNYNQGQQMGPSAELISPAGQIEKQYSDRFFAGQANPRDMAALSYDESAPDYIQKAARVQHLEQLKEQQMFGKIEKKLASGNTTDYARMLKDTGEEGSYFKAYLFNRLGLTELAKQEQNKISGGSWQSALGPNSERAILQFDANGLARRGFDSAGKELTKDQLAKFASNTMNLKGANVGASDYFDPVTKQTLQKVNTVNGPIYYDKAGNRVVPQGEPYALNTGSNLGVKELAAQIDTISALRKEFGTNALKAEDAFERKYGFFGSPGNPMTREEFRTKYGIKEGMPGTKEVPTPPAAPVTGPGGAIVPSASMTAPTDAPKISQENQTVVDTGGFMKVAGPAAETPEQRAQRQFNTPLDTATRESNLQQRGSEQAITSAGAGATVTAKTRAERVEALPSREDDARRVIRTINEVVNHPGFEISTGATAPIGSFLAMIPGSPFGARDWRAKYGELKGQQFLEAYQALRGTGGISEKEGSKAEQAVAALGDPGISESEFKRNAELLKNDVKRRIDTERKGLGMKPLDWSQVETDMKKDALSEKDRAALTWADKNPKDPRADKIRKELGF